MEQKKTPFDAYRRTDVLTATKENVLLMLYQGAIRFLRQGISAGENGDVKERARLLCRVQEIVTELRATLNFEIGGELAKSLDGLYEFVSFRLMRATGETENKGLKDALTVLETLHDGWAQAIDSLKKDKK